MTNILSKYAMKHNLRLSGKRLWHILHINLSYFGKSNIISEHIMYKKNILSAIMGDDIFYMT